MFRNHALHKNHPKISSLIPAPAADSRHFMPVVHNPVTSHWLRFANASAELARELPQENKWIFVFKEISGSCRGYLEWKLPKVSPLQDIDFPDIQGLPWNAKANQNYSALRAGGARTWEQGPRDFGNLETAGKTTDVLGERPAISSA